METVWPVLNLKVYVDTCFLSEIVNQQLKDEDLKAVDALCDRDDIEFVTSKKTFDEFQKTGSESKRVAFKLLFKIIGKIPSQHLVNYPSGALGTMMLGAGMLGGGGPGVENTLFTQLKTVFDDSDAEHIFLAASAMCDYFLTIDQRTILNRVTPNRDKLEELTPNLSYVRPKTLLEKLASRGVDSGWSPSVWEG